MRDADVSHGAKGRPADRASMMAGPGINWCMTLADMNEDEAEDEAYEPTGPDLMEPTG